MAYHDMSRLPKHKIDCFAKFEKVFQFKLTHSIADPDETLYEPPRGKTNNICGFRTGPIQTELYKHRKELEA